MTLLTAQEYNALCQARATQMTETGTVHRKPPGPQPGDVRDWPIVHVELGLLTTSRRLSQARDGLLTERDQPQWITRIESATRAGDMLHVRDCWFAVGAARTQTIQTAATFPLTEVKLP